MRCKRSVALVLTVVLLFAAFACTKDGASPAPVESQGQPENAPSPAPTENQGQPESGLPVLYIDGTAYPVTVEDGIKGLEQVHDGVISMVSEFAYNEEKDMYYKYELYTFYHADGTKEENYQGARKIWLNTYDQFYFINTSLENRYHGLKVNMMGLPFSDEKVADENAFRALMERQGFFSYEDSFLHIYTETGPIDTSTQEFENAIRETVSRDSNWKYEINQNPDRMEEIIRNDRESWVKMTAEHLMVQEIAEGRSRIGCKIYVNYDQETGEITTSVHLLAEPEVIKSWYSRWSAAFGQEIHPVLH